MLYFIELQRHYVLTEGSFWQPCIEQVCWCHFDIFENFYNISKPLPAKQVITFFKGKLRKLLVFFSNKIFLSNTMLLILKRLPYNVNITFKGTGKPKDVSDWLYWDIHFIVMVWNQTHMISGVCLY